jgi:glycosyltransferase involved in cell wall biosynthesis
VNREFSILILASNPAGTIERAIRSARAQRPSKILHMDRACSDTTVAAARDAGGDLLKVISVPASATLGHVRQIGLDAIRTEYGMWLDADDELLPARAARLIGRLDAEGGDLAFDEIDLHDGVTGAFMRRLQMPPFLGGRRQIVRLFERNYLPGPGVPAFRTSTARRIGFDQALDDSEDFDFLLRAIVADARIVLVRQVGYRQFAYPATLSKDFDHKWSMTREALRKHDPVVVHQLFTRAGYHERTVAWGMVAFLTLRGDFARALAWLDTLPPGSRRGFHRGTLLAALGRHAEALEPLQQAYDEAGVPELLNNFGVVLAALGRTAEATSLFGDALREFPDYRDASLNLRSDHPTRLTLLPLRREAVASEYSPG